MLIARAAASAQLGELARERIGKPLGDLAAKGFVFRAESKVHWGSSVEWISAPVYRESQRTRWRRDGKIQPAE